MGIEQRLDLEVGDGEALGLGHRVAVLMSGCVAQVGSAESVFSRPEQVEIARFVGIETMIPGRVTSSVGGLIQVESGERRLEVEVEVEGEWRGGENVYIAVRPEEIVLHPHDPTTGGIAGNVLAGRITKVIPAETHQRVEVDCGVRVVAVVSRARVRELALEVGSLVQAAFPADAAHLIRRAGD